MANWNKRLVNLSSFWYNCLTRFIRRRGGMADTRDLKSLAHKAYGFESRWRHQTQNLFAVLCFFIALKKRSRKRPRFFLLFI